MRLRTSFALVPLSFVLCVAGPLGCARRVEAPRAPDVQLPKSIDDPAAFERAINDFALLELDTPQRPALRDLLIGYIAREGVRALEQEDFDGAMRALELAVGLYAPSELRGSQRAVPLADLANQVYELAARRGMEQQAVLALAVQRHFDPEVDLPRLEDQWAQILAWQTQARRYSRDPMHSGDTEMMLEEITALFPSPWLVEQLAATYGERHERARRLLEHGEAVGPGDQHRLEYTGYKLARLYLRADDPEAAIAALGKVARDPASIELQALIEEVFGEPKSARPAAQLLEYFRPTRADDMPEYAVTQGWGIVEVIARHTLQAFPDAPRQHLALADAFMEYGYGRAALHHYRTALAARDDLFEAWARVAQLEQVELEIMADEDPMRAKAELERIEAFHAKAVQKWPDRPVRPGLPQAYVTVAEGLYHAGEIESAKTLVRRATELEPLPEVLDLSGLIAFKEARWADANTAYRALLTLPFEDQYERVYWEIRARTQLGEVGLRSGDASQAREDLRAALSELNLVLSLPGIDPEGRSLWLTERARVFFHLGEDKLAMEDFRASIEGTPTRSSAYSEPLLFCVAHGRQSDAIEIYEQAMANDVAPSLKLYFTLWIVELTRRTKTELPEGASAYLESFDGDAWEESLAAHALGKLSGKDLIARAKEPGEIAEAHFYEGVRQWRTGETDAGLDHLRKVLESGMLSFFEYEMASDYLSWRDLPRTARSPVHEHPRKPLPAAAAK